MKYFIVFVLGLIVGAGVLCFAAYLNLIDSN